MSSRGSLLTLIAILALGAAVARAQDKASGGDLADRVLRTLVEAEATSKKPPPAATPAPAPAPAAAAPATTPPRTLPGVPHAVEPAAAPQPRPAEPKYTLTGPYAYKNLAVYLVHAPQGADGLFITMDEGVSQGLAEVKHTALADGERVQISNHSQWPLFLQEGQNITVDGERRRVLRSMVVHARTSDVDLPVFALARADGTTPETALDLPLAAVRQPAGGGAAEQDAALYVSALRDLPARHRDAVGVALAIDGKIEEANIYGGHTLMEKMYPLLLHTYALAAAATAEGRGDVPANHPATTDVADFVRLADEPTFDRRRRINDHTETRIIAYRDRAQIVTLYNGRPVHVRWTTTMPVIEQAPRPNPTPVPDVALNPAAPPRPDTAAHTPLAFKAYTIQSGDTLSAIAKQHYGSEAAWPRIAEANADLDPNRLKVGQTIKLPGLTATAPPAASPSPAAPAPPPRAAAMRIVKVQPGDTLSHIAHRELGKASYWTLIHEANRDQLPNPGDLKVGMDLRIPPRPE